MDLREIVRGLCLKTGMYVYPPTFWSVCAFIQGFDCAREGVPLNGFREWLIPRLGTGTNIGWPGLVEMALNLRGDQLSLGAQKEALGRLGELFEEFFTDREQYGIENILCIYNEWLKIASGD